VQRTNGHLPYGTVQPDNRLRRDRIDHEHLRVACVRSVAEFVQRVRRQPAEQQPPIGREGYPVGWGRLAAVRTARRAHRRIGRRHVAQNARIDAVQRQPLQRAVVHALAVARQCDAVGGRREGAVPIVDAVDGESDARLGLRRLVGEAPRAPRAAVVYHKRAIAACRGATMLSGPLRPPGRKSSARRHGAHSRSCAKGDGRTQAGRNRSRPIAR